MPSAVRFIGSIAIAVIGAAAATSCTVRDGGYDCSTARRIVRVG